VHIYATTELGRCFSVTDGRAGFPRELLDTPSADGVAMLIREDELLVRSANAMEEYDRHSGDKAAGDDWTATGDLVQVDGDRVLFVGRRSDRINVGGNKVHPIEVERVIRELAEVADVRVYAKSSSVAGQLVACDVVPAEGGDAQALRRRLAEHCLGRLAPHQRPRLVNVVEEIALAGSGKTKRRAD